jgi:hypothetical protein
MGIGARRALGGRGTPADALAVSHGVEHATGAGPSLDAELPIAALGRG